VSIAEFFCGGLFNGAIGPGTGRHGAAGEATRLPPPGWIPPRERAKMRQPKPLPEKVPASDRVPVLREGAPRTAPATAPASATEGAGVQTPASGGTTGATGTTGTGAPKGGGKGK
jgi:hypothetical protein